MSNKVYRFILKLDENTYLYVDSNGNIATTTSKTALVNSPINWDSIAIHVSRNVTSWGIVSKRSPQLTFGLDGAAILRNLFYTHGYEAKCILLIEKFNPTTYEYQFFTDCDVDFSYMVDVRNTVTVNLVERGLFNIMEARKDVPYEIPLDGDPDTLTCLIDGIKIKNVVSYSPLTYVIQPDTLAAVNLVSFYRLSELGTGYMPNSVSSTQNPVPSMYKAATNDPVKITLTNLKLNYNYNCFIRISINTLANIYWEWNAATQGNTINQSFTIPLNQNDIVFIWIQAGVSPVIGAPPGFAQIDNVNDQNKASIEVEAVLRFAPTTAKGLRYWHFVQKLVHKMTNGQYSVQSNFLSNPSLSVAGRRANWDNDPWDTIVLCGNSIRGLEGSAIMASLADVFKDCFTRLCLGFGIENNVLRIEPISYFLNKTDQITTIKLVKNIEVAPYMEKVSTHIKIGFNNFEYDELSGKEEYNTSLTFLFDKVTRKPSSLEEWITPFRADMYGIEKLRNYLNPDAVLAPQVATIDNTSDNNTFLLDVAHTPVSGQYVPYRLPSGVVAGLSEPDTAMNVSQTPKRMFLRHLSRLKSMLPVNDRGNAIYQTTDKNSELISNYGNGLIIENLIEKADVNMNGDSYLNRPSLALWKPFTIKAKAVPDRNTQAAIEANRYGFIQLADTDRDRTLTGFILDSILKTTRGDAGVNEETEFNLLAHPDSILY